MCLTVNEDVAGSIPAPGALSAWLFGDHGRASQWVMAAVWRTAEGKPWGFDSPSFRWFVLVRAPGRAVEAPVYQTGQAGSTPAGRFSLGLGRLTGKATCLRSRGLGVRIPPEPFQIVTSSRSSLECSPHCQCGGHGFKSHRGRLEVSARYANWQSDGVQNLVTCGFESHSCYFSVAI